MYICVVFPSIFLFLFEVDEVKDGSERMRTFKKYILK